MDIRREREDELVAPAGVSLAFVPAKTFGIVAAWPDGEYNEALKDWFYQIDVRNVQAVSEGQPHDVCTTYNACLQLALQTPRSIEHFIFADKDIEPFLYPDDHQAHDTRAFLENRAPVVGCEYQTSHGGKAWDAEAAFHLALWRCERRALEALAAWAAEQNDHPMVHHAYARGSHGTRWQCCPCLVLAEHFWQVEFGVSGDGKPCGVVTCHAGWAHHEPGGRQVESNHAR
jgi:hypothetical protein